MFVVYLNMFGLYICILYEYCICNVPLLWLFVVCMYILCCMRRVFAYACVYLMYIFIFLWCLKGMCGFYVCCISLSEGVYVRYVLIVCVILNRTFQK